METEENKKREEEDSLWKTLVSKFGNHEWQEEENTRVLGPLSAGRMVWHKVSLRGPFGSLKRVYGAERKPRDW